MGLYPQHYEQETISPSEFAGETLRIGYRGGIFFDGTDLVRNGLHDMTASTGVEAWEQWCQKCLQTERYCSILYPTDFGIQTEEAFHAATRALAESILRREIEEALTADPYGRTSHVEQIQFQWIDSDSLSVRVKAVGIENATIDLTTSLGRSGT